MFASSPLQFTFSSNLTWLPLHQQFLSTQKNNPPKFSFANLLPFLTRLPVVFARWKVCGGSECHSQFLGPFAVDTDTSKGLRLLALWFSEGTEESSLAFGLRKATCLSWRSFPNLSQTGNCPALPNHLSLCQRHFLSSQKNDLCQRKDAGACTLVLLYSLMCRLYLFWCWTYHILHFFAILLPWPRHMCSTAARSREGAWAELRIKKNIWVNFECKFICLHFLGHRKISVVNSGHSGCLSLLPQLLAIHLYFANWIMPQHECFYCHALQCEASIWSSNCVFPQV